jgi:hypothetical protein
MVLSMDSALRMQQSEKVAGNVMKQKENRELFEEFMEWANKRRK